MHVFEKKLLLMRESLIGETVTFFLIMLNLIAPVNIH